MTYMTFQTKESYQNYRKTLDEAIDWCFETEKYQWPGA